MSAEAHIELRREGYMGNRGFWSGMFLIVLMALSGCASPQVQYKKVDSADTDGIGKFRFAESIIKFDYVKGEYGTVTDQLSIVAVPRPYWTTKFGIVGSDFWRGWGVVTTLNVTYRGDTDLIQEVGVDVSDKRVQTIQTIGSLAIGAAGFLAASPVAEKLPLPTGISITGFLEKIPEGCHGSDSSKAADRDGDIKCDGLTLDGTIDYVGDIVLSARPVDAFELASIDFPYTSKAFLYSACRSLTVVIRKARDKSIVASATVAVADPKWIEALAFPAKGKITVQASCGAGSTAQDASLPTAVDYVNALLTQAGAVKTSLTQKATSGATKATGTTGGGAGPK